MADQIVLHDRTKQDLDRQFEHAHHGLLVVGPKGMGKASLAGYLIHKRHEHDRISVGSSPYIHTITPADSGSISIEAIRQIEHFLSRRVPVAQPRTILIDTASAMTTEAQNALLKMLEEPPADTVFILTAETTTALLPTIQSRTMVIHAVRPDPHHLRAHFTQNGFAAAAVQRAELMSGGLPGLMHTLLNADADHPLTQAAELARAIIQKSSFERLTLVDQLAKNRQLCLDTVSMLQQMAHVSLANGSQNQLWQTILAEAYAARQLLANHAQPKLVVTNLMLNLTV